MSDIPSITGGPPNALWCFAQLALVKLSLSLFGFGLTLSRYDRAADTDIYTTASDDPLIERTANRVAAAAALYPGRALCLEQSLVLNRELRRRGIDSRLRFGVYADPFAGHVWVEVNGFAVNEMVENLNTLIPLEG